MSPYKCEHFRMFIMSRIFSKYHFLLTKKSIEHNQVVTEEVLIKKNITLNTHQKQIFGFEIDVLEVYKDQVMRKSQNILKAES